jgi:predicted O-methyltransferase YrrM
MEAIARERGFPIVGPEVGRLLAQMAGAISARRVFEMGSGYGYSTLWFARAVGPEGRVHHTEGDPANTELARSFLTRAGVADRVVFHNGDACALIDEVEGDFDIVFCDVDKHQYPEAYDRFRHRVRPGGLAIVDNLLWSGKVAAGLEDRATSGVRTYISRMWADRQYLSSLLPVRDGVGVSWRLP